MLDVETKKIIDNARDILVGKLPAPNTQVEQITLAMLYKFMDDIDQESIEMGGVANYFSGTYEQYSWREIMYLHGCTSPNIIEYDTLTFDERWEEKYDVILANPPFFTPKGGITPHNIGHFLLHRERRFKQNASTPSGDTNCSTK